MSFGNRLKSEIKRHGYTQRRFSEAMGTYEANVSRWVHGVLAPSLRQLDKILGLLPETDARWLITGLDGSYDSNR